MEGHLRMEDIPVIAPRPPSERPAHFFGDYDAEMDTFTLQYRESVAGATFLHQTGGFYLIVDSDTHEVIGMHLEGWTSHYVSAIPTLRVLWADLQDSDLDPSTQLPKHNNMQEPWYTSIWEVLSGLWVMPTSALAHSSTSQLLAHAAR